MMGDVIRFNGITRNNLNPEDILSEAKDRLKTVVILGYEEDGSMYFASSVADGGDVLWLLEKTKQKLLDITID